MIFILVTRLDVTKTDTIIVRLIISTYLFLIYERLNVFVFSCINVCNIMI